MKISIVIPNYNGKALLENNLPKIIDAVDKDVEIIVVDDASTDGSVILLKQKFPIVRLIQNEINRRFGATCNIGVKETRGEIVILLNSDVVPARNFIKPLVDHFSDHEVFSVGCKEIDVKDDKEVISGRTEGSFCRGMMINWWPKDQISQDTLWTFGGSMAVDRKKYLHLGGFDEIYSPAYWEDIDLCYRARQKGWKILYEKNSVVYHNHETTNQSVFGKRKMEIISFRNQILFVWKNIKGNQLRQHFLWLPYHLTITNLKTKGAFGIGFILAIWRYFVFRSNTISGTVR